MPGSCGCSTQTLNASHFVCSTDYTHRRFAPMIVNNVVAYDTPTFIESKTTIPERSTSIGMIFNNKAYKLTSSQGIDNQKQMKFDHAETDTSSDNNIATNIPLANFGIFNKSRLRYKQNSQIIDTRYGKNFSQERYLMKKKQANFKCQNSKFIC